MTAVKNVFIDAPDSWAEDATAMATEAKAMPMNLKRAIGYFADIEAQCDAAIQEQDTLIREITRRITPRVGAAENAYVPLTTDPAPRTELRATDLPYEEYHQISSLANRVLDKQMPMATRRFMNRAGRGEIDEIEDFEVKIGCLRQRMRDLEHHILNHTPQTAKEVALKLKFMASLMIDGGEIEVDFFAYLVEESAEILEVTLHEEGLF